MRIFRHFRFFLIALSCGLGVVTASAQSGNDAVRVTVTMNPDGSKTVYQTGGASRQTIATTTGADGKARDEIVYRLDEKGRYESGQVFAPNGSLRFKTLYQYDAAGLLTEETQLAKDGSARGKIVYSYDAGGHQTGYAIYDGAGKLLGRTTAKKPAAAGERTASPRTSR